MVAFLWLNEWDEWKRDHFSLQWIHVHTVSGQKPPGHKPPDKNPLDKNPPCQKPPGQKPPRQKPPREHKIYFTYNIYLTSYLGLVLYFLISWLLINATVSWPHLWKFLLRTVFEQRGDRNCTARCWLVD